MHATRDLGVDLLGVRITGTLLLALLAAFLATVGIALFLQRTRAGLLMRSLANDRDLSAMLGVSVVEVETVAWLISVALCGFSGLMLGDLVRLNPTLLTFLAIPQIAVPIVH